ncbi:Ger(x)C family spore germination protein [Paenibacillus whitsoniae]|uniref:Ger(X)C family spore germination protein n=1 Tax=Paenibacillus whitsoniae TaxID=2496558 RepID=A0A3S0I6J1_9BACL|nr:Ger(x)C family spore germination protein [Paenibacillus whitsoniae]RTE02984.1 Ger(x)C family spore germination protein [Paenibacillus whitsoniae]
MKYKLMMITLCMLLLTGCWSRRELNQLLIALGIGIDWVDGEYLVSFQVVNPSEISEKRSSSYRPPSTLYQARGRTIFEAARSLTAEAPRKIYMGHLQMYVIGESLARRDIRDFIDSAFRDNETRMDFNIVVARGTSAENILKLYTPLEKLPTYNMQQSLKTSQQNWAPTIAITLDELLKMMSGTGYEPAITGIRIVGESKIGQYRENIDPFQPPSRFRYSGIAAFKEGKLIAWLNEEESKGYTDLTNHLDSTSISVPCGKQQFVGIEVTSSTSKLKTAIVDGNPQVTISIRAEANVVDRACRDVDLTLPDTILKLQDEGKEIIQANVESAVKRVKALRTDIVGFGSMFAKEHPDYWKTVKTDWNDTWFPQVQVRYDISLFLRNTGTTSNTTLQ